MHETFHDVQSFVYVCRFFQGHTQPTTQGARAHRGDGSIDDVCQGASSFVKGIQDFKITQREAIQQDAGRFVDAGDRGDVSHQFVLCHVEVVQYCACGGNTAVHFINTESL